MTGHRGRGGYRRGGPPGFGPRGRRARRGAVKAAVLVLLDEEPRNGYALIQEIEARSEGAWRPSPGSIYPALAMMEDEGLIKSVESGDQRAYELTDAGREALAKRGEDTAAPWEPARDDVADDTVELFKTMRQVYMASRQITEAGSTEQIKQAEQALAETRRTLYGLLAEDPEAE
ncbi:MAG TPA: PadR family transcriptional regulator [Thermoleophilaceae bacterium]|nr:PadR family transcriptional regulator [Thermoleophilaceae bacterium]